MTNNTTLPGTGDVIATRDVSGVKYQIMLTAIGTTPTEISATNPMPVMGNGIAVGVELTRPSNTTKYDVGDAVNDSTSSPTLLEFQNVARVNGGSVYLVGATLYADAQKTPRIRVHLYNASNPTIAVDNAAFKELYADKGKELFDFDFPALAVPKDAANSTLAKAQNPNLRTLLIMGASTTSLYATLETLDTFTPTSGQKFYLVLYFDRN